MLRARSIRSGISTPTPTMSWNLPSKEKPAEHRLLRGRVEDEGRGPGKDFLHQVQAQGRLVVGRGDQDRDFPHRLQTPIGVVIQISEKNEMIVFLPLPFQGVDQRRRIRALLSIQRISSPGMGVEEDPVRVAVEGLDIARPLDAEPFDHDAVEDGLPVGYSFFQVT